jgi:hypothetical protein
MSNCWCVFFLHGCEHLLYILVELAYIFLISYGEILSTNIVIDKWLEVSKSAINHRKKLPLADRQTAMPGRIRSPSPASSTTDTVTIDVSSPLQSTPQTPPSSASSTSTIQRTPTSTVSTPARARQILVRNRRLHYLTTHPAYFTSPDLELADPLLYDRLIRQYLTPSEREEQGRSRGWSGVLEADLTRAEAKVAAVAEAHSSSVSLEARAEMASGEAVSTRAEGEELWRETMTLRFLEGRDTDADYSAIDESEEWDDLETERREEEEKWFDAETPSHVMGDTGVLDY